MENFVVKPQGNLLRTNLFRRSTQLLSLACLALASTLSACAAEMGEDDFETSGDGQASAATWAIDLSYQTSQYVAMDRDMALVTVTFPGRARTFWEKVRGTYPQFGFRFIDDNYNERKVRSASFRIAIKCDDVETYRNDAGFLTEAEFAAGGGLVERSYAVDCESDVTVELKPFQRSLFKVSTEVITNDIEFFRR